jgi:hypothetical protein
MSRRRSRRPKYEIQQRQRVHDRASAIIPFNAKIVIDEVDDPFGQPDFAEFDEARGELQHSGRGRITVVRSIRADPLGALHAQGAIDEVQYTAGLMWAWAYTHSSLGPLKAIDLTADRICGAVGHHPTTEATKRALGLLKAAGTALGFDGSRLVEEIIGRGSTIAMAADARGNNSKSGREYVGRRFRECLDCLAVVFGCATSIPGARPDIPRQTLTPPR